MQASTGCRDTERMVPRLLLAVPFIIEQQERCGEKHLLCLARRNPMALVLAGVPGVPVELSDLR
jgi:hypothetical protein